MAARATFWGGGPPPGGAARLPGSAGGAAGTPRNLADLRTRGSSRPHVGGPGVWPAGERGANSCLGTATGWSRRLAGPEVRVLLSGHAEGLGRGRRGVPARGGPLRALA